MVTDLNSFNNEAVLQKFLSYPEAFRSKLLFLRELILKVATNTPGVGAIEETLKWGEPSYLTSTTKSGSTIRLDWKKSYPDQYCLYFHCKTTLVESFKEIYGDLFQYGGNRSLIFYAKDKIPVKALSHCLEIALTYNIKKTSKR